MSQSGFTVINTPDYEYQV